MSLREEFERAIELWESQELEFMEKFPDNIHELAKEIAAFATSNPGTIYIGVSDDRIKVGISDKIEDFARIKDNIQNRIAGIVQNTIQPAIDVNITFIEVKGKLFVKIIIPKGKEPVYYTNNKPYYRNLTTSQPAPFNIVKELHRLYFQEMGQLIEQSKDNHVFFDILMQLSDFELLWTDYENRMVNPDMQQLRYDINVGSDIILKKSFESIIQEENFEGELQDISRLMKELAHHSFSADGGESYKKFQKKGNIIVEKIKLLKPRIMKRISIPKKDVENINDDLIKLIRELKNYWSQRQEILDRGEIDSLKESMRRISYSFYRISNIPAIINGQKYSSNLREIAITLRELSSIKYFRKGIGINPLDNIKDKMNLIIQGMNNILEQLE